MNSTTILKEFSECADVSNITDFYYWMFKEYKKHMALSIDDAENTLNQLSVIHPEFKQHIDVLLLNIDTCGILQSYFEVAIVLLDKTSNHKYNAIKIHTEPLKKWWESN